MKIINTLKKLSTDDANLCGHKATSLAIIARHGMQVPSGICLTRHAYDSFIHETGLDKLIIGELSRKRFEDMRWEELWDASLRIRNYFTNTAMPPLLEKEILSAINIYLRHKPLAIRSSSLAEDSPEASFAGIHESFVNITTPSAIIKCIKLVWASLWSDAALLYQKELGLNLENSAMAIIIQEMIIGETSGIAFCESPNNRDHAVIESIYGLNKGLVDGDIEPDRFFIDRNNKKIISVNHANHERKVAPTTDGVTFKEIPSSQELSLHTQQVNRLFGQMEMLEKIFGGPQDIEWTFKADNLYILQSRPITVKAQDEKQWYLSLRRSLDNLETLAHRVEKEILPQMEKEADQLALSNLEDLSNEQLILELEKRQQKYDHWHQIYWDECIPLAHGVRLFGTVYNDKIQPEDPYEFVDLILPDELKSTRRNEFIEKAAQYLKDNPAGVDSKGHIIDPILKDMVKSITQEIKITLSDNDSGQLRQHDIITLLREMAHKQTSPKKHNISVQQKLNAFLSAFTDEEQEYAKKIVWLARKSYQLRDDDNISLGKLSGVLSSAVSETNLRIKTRYKKDHVCRNAEEAIKSLKFPQYKPTDKHKDTTSTSKMVLNMRQLRGQPAGKGIARGPARVIQNTQDLYKVKRDEILICDAIDPNMTFIIPLVSAIVERRGGMLIHGAIIAREYGIACVTGIPKATTLIHNGDDITVDGYFGLVINHSRTIQ